jgi:excinuclease ABC subunit A
VIDLGPEGGDRGGYVVATGTPAQIAKAPGSYTGQFLSGAGSQPAAASQAAHNVE